MKKIKTGADKLVELIQESKKISLEDSAKALGVGKDLVLQWAEFLEKEKLISIEYSFSKAFFTERSMSSKEIKESAKEIVHEKDAFVNKIDYALASLERESVNFDEIKKKFSSVQGEVKEELKIVETELKELEKYNDLKSNVDKELEVQKKKHEQDLKELSDAITNRDNEYLKIYTKIIKEKEDIEDHKKQLEEIKGSQKEVEESIKSATAVLHKLKDDLHYGEGLLKNKINSFDELKNEFEKLNKKVADDKKNRIKEARDKLDKQFGTLLEKQDQLLKDAKEKTSKLEGYAHVGKKIKGSFEGFFKKILDLSKKIEEIDADKVSLKKNFLAIKEKAKALQVMKSTENLKEQALKIEQEIKKQEESKKKLFGKIRSLLDDLKV